MDRLSPQKLSKLQESSSCQPGKYITSAFGLDNMRMKTTSKIIITVTLCLVYAAAYGTARNERWLIHRVGYFSNAGGHKKVAEHHISSGDFGSPMLAPRVSTAQGFANMFFWPAIQAELIYWNLAEPHVAAWKNEHTLNQSPNSFKHT